MVTAVVCSRDSATAQAAAPTVSNAHSATLLARGNRDKRILLLMGAVRLGRGLFDILVDERDCHAALADARCDALHRSVTNVARRKDTGYARFKQVRIARRRRTLGLQIEHV